MNASRLSPTGRYGVAAIITAAVLAGIATWTVARLAGVDIEAEQNGEVRDIGPAAVAIVSVIGGLLAWGVHSLLARREWLRWWPFIGSTALAISIIGPSWLADGAAAVALIAMHVVVAAVLIAGFSMRDLQLNPAGRSGASGPNASRTKAKHREAAASE
ncbi:MAG: DUF6069 family protein [Dehalococcoidia bacterium]